MPETFLHGVEVVEVDNGARVIRTVRSSIIGLIGTAPDATPSSSATLTTGTVSANSALTYTSKIGGALGNNITVRHADPRATSAALSVSVSAQAVTITLATDSTGAITSTAAQVKAAIEANAQASALVTVTNTGASTGAGVVAAMTKQAALSGGADEAFPLNTPVLIAGSRTEAAKLGSTGTLPAAIDGIFDQVGAVVVVVRVAEGADEAETLANVVGGIDTETGEYTGVLAFLSSKSATGFTPKILCAPGFTHQRPDGYANPVAAEMLGVANRLRAIVIKDGVNSSLSAAIADRSDYGSKRAYIVDPFLKVFSNGDIIDQPPSARVAGLIARVDNEEGFWTSPSNHEIYGVSGTGRPVDFVLGDSTCSANLLNESEVATVIREDGFRLWGNRTCSADPQWSFLSVVRTADMINESILTNHLWAVDKGITKNYLDEVVSGVNGYLSSLQAQGAILGGECWADKELNTPANIADGKVFFAFKFTPPYPAEHVTFRSMLVGDYLEDLGASVAAA